MCNPGKFEILLHQVQRCSILRGFNEEKMVLFDGRTMQVRSGLCLKKMIRAVPLAARLGSKLLS